MALACPWDQLVVLLLEPFSIPYACRMPRSVLAKPTGLRCEKGQSVPSWRRESLRRRESLLLPTSFLLLLVRPGAPSSFLLLVVRHLLLVAHDALVPNSLLFLLASCYYQQGQEPLVASCY